MSCSVDTRLVELGEDITLKDAIITYERVLNQWIKSHKALGVLVATITIIV